MKNKTHLSQAEIVETKCWLKVIDTEIKIIEDFEIIPKSLAERYSELLRMKSDLKKSLDKNEALLDQGSIIEAEDIKKGKKNFNQARKGFSPEELKLKNKFSEGEHGIITNSQSMLDLFQEIQDYKDVDNILVTGETGTGKELVSNWLHKLSKRSHNNLITVNCAAFDKNLIEGELFGWEEGSHSKAHKSRKGFFRTADKGSIFLDEIGELPSEVQATLLRISEKGEVQPIGADKLEIVDVKIISATNRDLKSESENGNFRKDLIPRLAEVTISIPPLRDRPNDISALCYHFFKKHFQQYVTNDPDCSKIEYPKAVSEKMFESMTEFTLEYNVRDIIQFTSRLILRNKILLNELRPWMLPHLYKDEKLTISKILNENTKDSENNRLDYKYFDVLVKFIDLDYNVAKTAKYYEKDNYTIDRKLNTVILQIGNSVGFGNAEFIKYLREFGILDSGKEEQFISKFQIRIKKIIDKTLMNPAKPVYDPEVLPIAESLLEKI